MSHPTLQEKPLAFLDIETGGLFPEDGAEIIEIAIAITITTGSRLRRLLGRPRRKVVFKYVTKVMPDHPERISEEAQAINGFNMKEWEGAPSLRDVLPLVAAFLKDCVIAGQNVRFDVGFLNYYTRYLELDIPRIDYHLVDTVTLAYEHLVGAGAKKVSLKDICTFIGIEPEPDKHRAMAGALTAFKVYERLSRAGKLDRVRWMLRNGLF